MKASESLGSEDFILSRKKCIGELEKVDGS